MGILNSLIHLQRSFHLILKAMEYKLLILGLIVFVIASVHSQPRRRRYDDGLDDYGRYDFYDEFDYRDQVPRRTRRHRVGRYRYGSSNCVELKNTPGYAVWCGDK